VLIGDGTYVMLPVIVCERAGTGDRSRTGAGGAPCRRRQRPRIAAGRPAGAL